MEAKKTRSAALIVALAIATVLAGVGFAGWAYTAITRGTAASSQDNLINYLRTQMDNQNATISALKRANVITTWVWESPCESGFFGGCSGTYDYKVDWVAYANIGTVQANGATFHMTFYSSSGGSGSVLCKQDIVLGSGGVVTGQTIAVVGNPPAPFANCGSGSARAMSTAVSVTWT